MKVSVAGVVGEDGAHELTADLAILVQLSTTRDAQVRLARERDALFAARTSHRQPIEETFDRATADLDPSGGDLSPRLEALAKEYAATEERARRLAASLSPDARRIYSSLVARRHPFVVALKGDCCSGCNMRLPSGLLGEIRRVRRLHLCPSCKRVLSPPSLQR